MRGRVIAVCLLAGALALPVGAGAAAPKLRAFDSCPSLVRYASGHAQAATPLPSVTSGPAPTAAPTADAEKGVPVDVSQTNVQEAGVDEPDVVKTDGRTLFAITGTTLVAIDARAATPKIVGQVTLPEGSGHELLIHDGRALVIASHWSSRGIPGPERGPEAGLGAADQKVAPSILPYEPPQTVLAEVDVRDPTAMKVGRTLTFDGSPVASRLTGATARVVVTSAPRYVVEPATRKRVAGWVPTATLAGPGLARPRARRLVDCRRVRRPVRFAGSGLVTVLTVDIDRGLPAVDTDAVMADAQTVYASTRGLYVATQRWEPDVAASSTAIHRFDTSQAETTTYDASGSVTGTLLSQWALSEHEGVLRVASTGERDSTVTTLAARDGRLAQLGAVGGLGPDERIRGVRFIGDMGYVVTFRQTDPLYTVDLSQPSAPRVVGELKILGYSAYLHPVGNGLLLGVGQDATDQGRTLGTQVSLFDVSDPARPQRLDQRTLGASAWSPVEGDHRAFLWWPDTRLAVMPLSDGSFSGAIGLRVGREQLAEAGRAAGRDGVAFSRAVVVGERVFLVAPEAGVQVASLTTLAPQEWVALPVPATPAGPDAPVSSPPSAGAGG